MTFIQDAVKRYKGSALARNTLTYTINFGLELTIQLGFFILVSRFLGPTDYGLFITLSAINALCVVIVGLGSDHLLIQRVAVDRSAFKRYFGHALTMALLSLPVAAAISYFAGRAIVGNEVSTTVILAISASHLVFGRLTNLCASIFMAFDKARWQLFVNVSIAATRALFLAVAVLVYWTDLTLEIWALWFLAASFFAALTAVGLVLWICGLPGLSMVRHDIPLGLQYCLEYMATAGVADMDKPVVTSTLGPEAAGIYAAGFRIVNAASAPVRALLFASYTRHFRNAEVSRAEAVSFGKKLLPFSLGISSAVAFCLIAFADIIPVLIGAEYEQSVIIIRLLALFPLFMGLSGIAADILRAIGKQHIRIVLLTTTALLMVPCVYLGAVTAGIEGAAIARVLLQALLVLTCWVILKRSV